MDNRMHYSSFTDEISAKDIYTGLLGHGLFTEKLPPIFTSSKFLTFCDTRETSFPKKPMEYVYHESMRNINTPRPLSIPNPAAYYHLCKFISEIWPELQSFFKEETKDQNHIISRTHIRKKRDSKSLFSMNYKNWKSDGTPEPDLLIGARYIVHADISNCFPSIYTHALSWALVGKDVAKQHQTNDDLWYNKLDKFTRNLKNGETHGLLIGPHASNLLSEIILVKIDKVMYDHGWRYIRNIDDYTCYVPTYEKAQLFLTELSDQLRGFDLSLNHKKTSIKELPTASVEQWVRRINDFTAFDTKANLNFKEVRAYLDMAIELMQDNNDNAAILNYAIKVLSKKRLSDNAKTYYVKTVLHLTVIYPYLIPLLEEFIFRPFDVEIEVISNITNLIYQEGLRLKNYEAICYAIYFAIKYGFEIERLDFTTAQESHHCLFLLFAFLYFHKKKDKQMMRQFKEYAKTLQTTDMESFWLFIYETLPASDLRDYWKAMKKEKVSFLMDF